MTMPQHPDAHVHQHIARIAKATVDRIEGSHDSKDPVVQFGSITAEGGLLLSGSSLALPPNGYLLAPDVLAEHPYLGADDQVVVVWADRGQARRPVVALVLSDVGMGTSAVTAVVNGDGTLTTASGRSIEAGMVHYTEDMRNRKVNGVPVPASTPGTGVIALWCDVDATRTAWVVAVQ